VLTVLGRLTRLMSFRVLIIIIGRNTIQLLNSSSRACGEREGGLGTVYLRRNSFRMLGRVLVWRLDSLGLLRWLLGFRNGLIGSAICSNR
jgi:hypothetical protein